ncbi:MAG TPA: hypothetical protein VF260_11980 [Bacilli bacterium]
MQRSKMFWGILIALIVALAYIVPYTALTDTHAWYGSFLWWGLTALFTIIINFIVTRDWSR